MSKILLVYEDYPDLMDIETTLKKVGFDVIGITNEVSVPENILSFNPDLTIGCGRGGKVSSLGVGKKLKEMSRWAGKSLLILQQGVRPTADDLLKIRMDLIIDAPVEMSRMLQVIAKLLGQDESSLLERYRQLSVIVETENSELGLKVSSASGSSDESVHVKGKVGLNNDNNAVLGKVAQSVDGLVSESKVDGEEKRFEQALGFKFGDKVSASDLISQNSEQQEDESFNLFADLDLGVLEKEITGINSDEMDSMDHDIAQISGKIQDSDPIVESTGKDLEVNNPVLVGKDHREISAPDENMISLEAEDNELVVDHSSSDRSAIENADIEKIGISLSDKFDNEKTHKTGAELSGSESDTLTVDSEELARISERVRLSLERANDASYSNPNRYSEFGLSGNENAASSSTVTRVGARGRQKDLQKDFNQESMNNIDELRREFVGALFKK